MIALALATLLLLGAAPQAVQPSPRPQPTATPAPASAESSENEQTLNSQLTQIFPQAPLENPEHKEFLADFTRRFFKLKRQQEDLNRLRARQMRMSQEMQRSPTPNSQPDEKPPLSREEQRVKLVELHNLQESLDKEQERFKDMTDRFADFLAAALPLLSEIREEWDQTLWVNGDMDDENPPPFMRNITNLINLVEEIKANPEKASDIIQRETRYMNFARGERFQGLVVQHFSERLRRLEQEQSILQQKLDANRQELQEIRRQMDRMSRMRQNPRVLESSSKPPIPTVEAEKSSEKKTESQVETEEGKSEKIQKKN
jgi:hypothetical protein